MDPCHRPQAGARDPRRAARPTVHRPGHRRQTPRRRAQCATLDPQLRAVRGGRAAAGSRPSAHPAQPDWGAIDDCIVGDVVEPHPAHRPPLGPPRPRTSLRPRESHPGVIPDYPGWGNPNVRVRIPLSSIKVFTTRWKAVACTGRVARTGSSVHTRLVSRYENKDFPPVRVANRFYPGQKVFVSHRTDISTNPDSGGYRVRPSARVWGNSLVSRGSAYLLHHGRSRFTAVRACGYF